LFRNLEIHDESNQLFERLTGETLAATASFEAEVGEAFTLQMYGQELVVCSRLLRLDDASFERASKLAELLVRAGIGALLIGSSTTAKNLHRFSTDLAMALKGEGATLQSEAYGEIRFTRLEEDPSTALATRPEQLALWLFSTLLDLSDELAQARARGHHPSLLPLKRVLQRITETARDQGATFQLLPAIRNYSDDLELAHRAVCETLTALGFGIRIGLDRRELLSGAIAAVLCRITPPGKDVVKDLLAYQGLGELGAPVLLTANDALHPSGESGLSGQLLALVRNYEDSLSTSGGALAPPEAIARLLSAPPAGVERQLAALFAGWQGREPLGSPIELDNGRLALVFGPSTHDSGQSRVATLEQGSNLGAEIDLGKPGAPRVKSYPRPSQLALDLCRVRSLN
jgi:hypothetical protein